MMDLQTEKLDLIRWLASIEDIDTIRKIKILQNNIQEEKAALTEEEKAAIDKGLQSIEEGRVKSHKEVTKLTKEKFPNLFK